MIVLALGGWHILRQYQVPAWPEANGQIIESGLAKVSFWPGRYFLRIRYRYEVQGIGYEGHRLGVSPWRWPLEANTAQALNQQYPPGKFIIVRHHPETPSLALLAGFERALPPGYGLLSFALLLVVSGLAWPWISPRPQ